MRKFALQVLCLLLLPSFSLSQARPQLSPQVRDFVREDTPVLALTHVRLIDGTGAPVRSEQTLIIRDGKISALGDAATTKPPDGAKVLDLTGRTIIPGLVGMHNHLFYTSDFATDLPGRLASEIIFTAPRLYLAAGVTTMRTTGSMEPYLDLNLKQLIDAGKSPGPKMDVTAPYLEGTGGGFPQMHALTGPDDARRLVNYWADNGATSFKAYMQITRAELGAAIEEAHKRGLKMTGHLCSVGFREAAELGIDNLEHGFAVDMEFAAGKKPDQCPGTFFQNVKSFLDADPNGPAQQELIHFLVTRHVAITSTLPVFELNVPGRPPIQRRVLDAMLPEVRANYLTARAISHSNPKNIFAAVLKREMDLECMFAKAGGTLLAGPDPTGIGGVLPGFGDQRGVELLVEAGFSPVEAIHIATSNGAEFLGQLDKIGTLATGKVADIVVIRGDPSANVSDIENVEIVFKDGVGYDSAKLIESVRGQVGLH